MPCDLFSGLFVIIYAKIAVMNSHFEFTCPLWIWPAKASWYFVTLPAEVAGEIRFLTDNDPFMPKRGFGSHKVEVTIGATIWQTSVFPDKASGSFVLPVKASVRKQESLAADTDITVSLRLLQL